MISQFCLTLFNPVNKFIPVLAYSTYLLVAISVTESQSNWSFILLPPDICEAFQVKKNKQKKNPTKLHHSKCFSFHILPTLETLPLSNISLFNPFLKFPFTIENVATVWEWAELFAALMEREKPNYFLAEIYASRFSLQPDFFSQVIKSEDNSSSHRQWLLRSNSGYVQD